MTDLVPRATVESIVGLRNQALVKFGEAHAALTLANKASEEAAGSLKALSGRESRFNHHLHGERTKFMGVHEPQTREEYLAVARRIVDTEVWSHVVQITDLERLMDKQAKDELHRQLMGDPPEVTVENIYATLERFGQDAGMIFRRGIANCFSCLNRRFRSHDGFKIGSRIVLEHMFDEHGWFNHRRDMESVLLDIERTFLVLDGRKVPPSWNGICGKLRESRYTGRGPRAGEIESEFFLVRVFKNGNAHVWFKRNDLVEKVNKLLAEYYGEVIPDGMTPEDDGGLHAPKTSLAKNYGYFPTPPSLAESIVDMAPLYRDDGRPKPTVLEPSAGRGALAALAAKKRAIVDCVEVQANLADELRAQRLYRRVTCADFLACQPDPDNLYDVVLMNPPFDRERDIDHVVHAMKFLKPAGFLVAIMSAGTELRETRKSIAFRALMASKKAVYGDLPAGSFAEAGTYVNTISVRLFNDGRDFYG